MAINVKSVNSILADMIRKLTLNSPITDVAEGSTAGTILEAAAIQDFQNLLSVLKVLESSNLQSLIGSELDQKAIEMNIPNNTGGLGRIPASRSSGVVRVSSAFSKKASAIYLGKPAPFAGSTKVYIQDATGWSGSGQFYIGRGTPNEEGPIQYTSITDNTTYFTLNLSGSTPLVRNHQYSEIAVLSQGGVRTISAGTVVQTPTASAVAPIQFTVDSSATLLDGESEIDVSVTCQTFGEDGNVSAGTIRQFLSVPFSGATVSNLLAISNGFSAESDEALRSRIKNYIATLSRGTKIAIESALVGLRDPQSGKTITSVNIVEPAVFGDAAKAYIDDGSGFEPSMAGQSEETLLQNSSGQEVLFRTANFPITPATIIGTRSGPFRLSDGLSFTVVIDGISETYTISASEYVNLQSVGVQEIVSAFNSKIVSSGVQNIGFRTANGLQNLAVFDLSGKAETLQILPSELQKVLGLTTDVIRPIYLYKSNKLLTFKGQTAQVVTAPYPWSSLGALDLQNNVVSVDGVDQEFTIANADFAAFGASIGTATLAQWATILKRKIAGVNITVSGSRLLWQTWQENSVDGKLEIKQTRSDGSPSTWIGINKMWSTTDVLSSVGRESDFELNRLSGQIRLLEKPAVGDNITAASDSTRAEVLSKIAGTGFFNVAPTNLGTPRMVVAADGEFAIREITLPGSLSISMQTLSANSNIVRIHSTDNTLFENILVGDFVFFNRDSSAANKFPSRASSYFKVRQKGLQTRASDEIFAANAFTYTAPDVNSNVTVTITTNAPHKAIVGMLVNITSVTASDPVIASSLPGSQTVASVVSPSQFTVVISAPGAVVAAPNSLNFSVPKDSYVDIETSKLEREALQGIFTDAPVTYSNGLADVTVYWPRHDFILNDPVAVSSVSAALAAVFSGPSNCTGTRLVKNPITADSFTLQFDVAANSGLAIPGPVTLNASVPGFPSSFDVTQGMIYGFKCEGAIPQVIDVGTVPTRSPDSLVAQIQPQLVGADLYKISPRQVGLRSETFASATSKIAILASIGTATNVFDASVSEGIQPHVAAKRSGYIGSGFAYVEQVTEPTTPSNFYGTHSFLKIAAKRNEVTDIRPNPSVSSTESTYPKGVQEIGISGRNANLIYRSYNNNVSAPFEGFARGQNVIKPLPASVSGTNEDDTSVSIRTHDLPFSFKDKLVVEMDLDDVNKTTSIPMYKFALTEAIQPFGQAPGSQIQFTLKDPEDEILPNVPRPFFDVNSPFRNFDLTDFNVLFAPTMLHTVYPALPYSGNPPDAFVIRSTQFGPQHEFRFGFQLPTAPNSAELLFNHVSFEENDRVVEVVNCTLTSGALVVGSEYSGLYTISESNITGPQGAAIVQLDIYALGLNLSGVFTVGNILNIGGSEEYSGAYIITGTPSFDTVQVASAGIRRTTPLAFSYDGSVAPISSYPVAAPTMQAVKTAADLYFATNPVFTMEFTTTTNPTVATVKFPSYYSHGFSAPNTGLANLSESLQYHAKRAPFGSLVHIHTYDPANNRIIGLSQSSAPILPGASDILGTGFSSTYLDQPVYLIPSNSKAVERWLQFTAISPLSIQSEINRVQNQETIQLNSLNSGSAGAVRVTGVAANNQIATAKASPFKIGNALKLTTDFAPAQSFPRGTLVEMFNSAVAPILRAYRTQPSAAPTDSAITGFNTADISSWFKPSTVVAYTRPSPNIGRFVFRKSNSGVVGGDQIIITKPNANIAKIQISGSGVLNARVGDMLVLRGSYSSAAPVVNYTSIFNTLNQCQSMDSDLEDRYIGYPIVHVESTTVFYVIAPNVVAETVTARHTSAAGSMDSQYQNSGPQNGLVRVGPVPNIASFSVGDVIEISGFLNPLNNGRYRVRDISGSNVYVAGRASSPGDESAQPGVSIIRQTTELMFVPMLKNEKNVRTNYKPGAPAVSGWKIAANEKVFYRVKRLGGGFVYADFSFSSHQDMMLDDVSVSSVDFVEFSDAFAQENRGRFRVVAHNGANAIIFKNDLAIDEIVAEDETIDNGVYGTHLWKIGPIDDANTTSSDKRHVRFWDADSVFESDSLVLTSPVPGTLDWFDSSVIGTWKIDRIGLNNEFDVFVESSIPNAASNAKTLTLASSNGAFSFQEGSPYVGYKWSAGYAHNNVSETDAEIFLMPQTLDYKVSPAYVSQLKAMHKIGFSDETTIGVDGYKYFTELIAEAHRVIDGSASNLISYPGVRAAGTGIEVTAPLIKSIRIGFNIESRDGVSLNAIKNPVKSVVSSYVNGLGVSREVVLSEIIRRVQEVPGVRSVTIASTSPVADDGVIKVGSFEVARISKPEDILV
jgi:uncharacterized phage protein gp47/JayE